MSYSSIDSALYSCCKSSSKVNNIHNMLHFNSLHNYLASVLGDYAYTASHNETIDHSTHCEYD